ncbi:MAG: hypothetical protein ACKE51_04670 [Methylococcaceae bacterium]
MENFSGSKEMIAPGIAGSTTTMITGTLVSNFGLPGAQTALVISLIFGALIFAEKAPAFIYKLVFYIINSMTIFSVAIGLNQAGMEISVGKPVIPIERKLNSNDIQPPNSISKQSGEFFQSWF